MPYGRISSIRLIIKMSKTGTVRSRIKRGDQVVFIAGKEYNRYDSTGKRQPYRGKVLAVDARFGKVKVEGAMIVKKSPQAGAADEPRRRNFRAGSLGQYLECCT